MEQCSLSNCSDNSSSFGLRIKILCFPTRVGVVVKASYSSLSSDANGSVGNLDRIGAETASWYKIDEINKGKFSLLPRYSTILEATYDEYDGGFEYHHAEKGYAMLTYWIPEGPCMLPANASHQVGVGGFVFNDKNEVLVVQEKYRDHDFHDCWKLPTGFIFMLYPSCLTALIFAVRHAHNVAFEKSDLFFICMLRPRSTEIKWMPLDEFIEQPTIRSDNMFNKITGICLVRMNKHYCGLASSSLYYNTTEDDHNCLTK
uniref:Uncharacterized protein n=1 Tax=Kalanchoe fedtschenkoi TaxID=63787 RepID=A0A7N1A970_KALFE